MPTLADRFELLQCLGEGAMGRVWLAEDLTAHRRVAVKVISAALGATEKSILMFKQEFRLMTGLRHPNCCEVYDYGVSADENPYFTMEVVPGQGLDELIAMSGPRPDARAPGAVHAAPPLAPGQEGGEAAGVPQGGLPPMRVRELLAQLLSALAYVHLQGYVHRDLKSANVRVRDDGTVKLMDYGLVDLAGRGGVIAGTLPYISPEMARREAVDCRSDLYAVGILAYEMLTGQVPFRHASPGDLLRAHLRDPVPPSGAEIAEADPALVDVVMKLLAKEPLARFQSAGEVLLALGFEAQAGEGAHLLYAPLIGRDEPRAQMGERIAAVVAKRSGGTLVLCGPSGIGKSRLTQEARHLAQLDGLVCASGACFATAQTPYGPFIQVLRQLLPSLQAQAPELMETYGRSLAILLPEIARESDAGEQETSADDWQRLQTAIAEALMAVSRQAGLVVLLDDWQWADPSSERLLTFMQREASQHALFFLVASRASSGPGDVLVVNRLGASDVGRLVAAMLGDHDVDPTFARQVSELADGNPAFVERVLEHLVRKSYLTHAAGRWQTAGGLPLDQLPRNHAALVQEALTTLPPDALLVARIGALVGREFDLDVMAYASGLENEALFAAVDVLRRARLLVLASPGCYAFAEDDFQAVLYEGTDPLDRAFLHGVLARAFEAKRAQLGDGQAPLELILAIAEHHLRAPSRLQALPWALEAGLRCAALQAGAEAQRLLAQALVLMDEVGHSTPLHERMEALEKLALVHRLRGDLGASIAAYEEALFLARVLGDEAAQGSLLIDQAKARDMVGDKDAGLALLAQGLEGPGAHIPGVAVSARVTRARILFFAGDTATAKEEAHAALALARQEAVAPHLLADAKAFLGFLLVTTDAERRAEGKDFLREAIAFHQQAGHKWRILDPYAYLGTAQSLDGDYKAARETFALMRETALACGMAPQAVIATINLTLGDLAIGDFRDGAACAAEADRLATDCGYAFPAPMANILAATCLTWLGDHGRAEERVSQAFRLLEELRSPYVEVQVQAIAMDRLLHLGRTSELESMAGRLAPLVAESRQSEVAAALALAQAEALLRQKRQAEAAASLAALAGQDLAPALAARKLRLEAMLALLEERWSAARSHLDEGLALATRMGAQVLLAEFHGLLGELALAEGARAASENFQAMAAAAAATAAPLLQALAAFGMAACDPYHPDAKQLAAQAQEHMRHATSGLSPAEREAYLAYPERRRVQEGNIMAFSLPRAQRTPPRPSFRPGFGPM